MNRTPVVRTPAVSDTADEVGSVWNLIDQTTANFIARVNAVYVTFEEMCLAAAEVQKLPLETCNREARTRCLALIFKGRRGKASVVNFRLEAMAKLIERIPSLWVRQNMVSDSVFFAAATEPLLLMANNEPFFDEESFLALLLETAEVDGSA